MIIRVDYQENFGFNLKNLLSVTVIAIYIQLDLIAATPKILLMKNGNEL